MNRPRFRGRKGQVDAGDLRAKINRLRQSREVVEDASRLEGDEDDNDDDDDISLSSEEESPPKAAEPRPTSSRRVSLGERSRSPPEVRRKPPSPHPPIVRDHSRVRSRSPRDRRVKSRPQPPPRRSSSPGHYRQHRGFPPRRANQSWEDKVEEFMKKLDNTKEPEDEPSCDNISLTPLMKFVAAKLTSKKVQLALTGPFQYSLLSLLSRSEWVAAKTIQLLEEAGHDNDWLYDTSAIKGGSGLKKDLLESVKSGKVPLLKDKTALNQVIRIIDIIVQYFTSDNLEDEGEDHEEEAVVDPRKVGVGAVLEQLAASQPPPPPPKVEEPAQEINHWSMLANNIQASSLSSFERLESYLSQDLLRVTSQNKEDAVAFLTLNGRPIKDAFEVARNMVMCWVNTGYDFNQLWNLVQQTNPEDILPPRDPSDSSRFFIGPRRPGDKAVLAHKFLGQMKTMNKSMNDRQLDYVVWKSLLYVLRGLGKSLQPAASTSSYNVSFNYLPPGLREMESKKYTNASNEADNYVTSSNVMMDLSEDPMNIIIDPNSVKAKGEAMPRRKYFVCAVHLEWIMFKGRPEVYEISIHCQDMASLELVIIPEALKKETSLLEALGFTLNKNMNKYFFVQPGMGCVIATQLNKAVEKLSQFLEAKRNEANENKNNGLVVLCKNRDSLSTFLEVITNAPDLTLNTVKGFGLLDSLCKLQDTQFNLAGNECCFTANVVTKTSSEEVLSKSKAELLLKALEAGLQVSNPGYETFVQPYCFPSDATKVKALKSRAKNIEAMYCLEMYVSAELRSNNVDTFLEGIYAPAQKDLRHKCDVVASKLCEALVDVGLDYEALKEKFGSAFFKMNPDLVLNQMDKPQRLKVLNQTLACLDFVSHYFKSMK